MNSRVMKLAVIPAANKSQGASACLVLDRSVGSGDIDDIFAWARDNDAVVPGDPNEEADDGPLVVVSLSKEGGQIFADQDRLLALLRGFDEMRTGT